MIKLIFVFLTGVLVGAFLFASRHDPSKSPRGFQPTIKINKTCHKPNSPANAPKNEPGSLPQFSSSIKEKDNE